MVRIEKVEEYSSAAKAGILAGDELLCVNGHEITDVLDYRFYLTEKKVTLTLSRNGETYEKTIRKGEYDDIGLEFETYLMSEKEAAAINAFSVSSISFRPECAKRSISRMMIPAFLSSWEITSL